MQGIRGGMSRIRNDSNRGCMREFVESIVLAGLASVADYLAVGG